MVLALDSLHPRPLYETDRVSDRSVVVRGEDAFLAVQVLSGVDRELFCLPYHEIAGAPRIVAQLEARANWTIGCDAVRLEVVGAVETVAAPECRPAGTQRLADLEEIGALPRIDVIRPVRLRVPLLEDRGPHSFLPDLDSPPQPP